MIVMDTNNKLIKRILKKKHLQRMGGNFVMILPKAWVTALEWTQEDDIYLSFHADDEKIVISKHEEISNIIPVRD